MLFNSLQFVLFFVILFTIYLRLGRRLQNRILLLASYFFYGSWDWRFLSLLFLSTVVDYFCGKWIHESGDRGRQKGFLLLSIAVNLSALGLFKYYDFFARSLQGLLEEFGVNLQPFFLEAVLPVGISFYTFQSMSYTMDIFFQRTRPAGSFLDFALFVSFFPQLVAGPIERAGRLMPQITARRIIRYDDLAEGAWMIFFGFFLKVFVADNMATIVDPLFARSGIIPGVDVLLGLYAFAFQIVGDFFGYSSIAVGVGRLLGFRLINNFLFPYMVTNPRQFWRNWHISLSTWLRDYLYIPMGGSRKGPVKTYRNLVLTMLLGGLWHGAAWTFVLFGAFHGLLLVCHRLARPISARLAFKGFSGALCTGLCMLFMFHLTCLGWLFFRARSIEQVRDLLVSLTTNMPGHSSGIAHRCWQVAFFAGFFVVIQILQKKRGDLCAILRLPFILKWGVILLMFYLIVIWGNFGGKEFIYFQF